MLSDALRESSLPLVPAVRPGASPLRQLARLAAVAAVAFGALLAHAVRVEAGADGVAYRPVPRGLTARPDSSDSTDADSLRRAADSLAALAAGTFAADTTDDDTTRRARTYLPGVPDAVRGYSVSIAPPTLPGLRGRLGTYWRRTVTLDSAAYSYTVREAIGEDDVRAPADVPLAQYLTAQRQAALASSFRTLTQQRTAGRRRQGVGFTVDIPGGQQSAFRTLFGRNEVDLTVSGRSDVDVGVNYNTNALNQAATGRNGDLAPAFGQELNLNVAGTIGDKLRINVNYDTQSEFEFENRVSLVYTGYADDIVQRVEAGNVFLETPSELIRGGQRLFGLRTDLQFGPLAVTAVASQQDAEATSFVAEGGSQATPFQLAPFEYEDNTHFFLGYFFHNWWDAAHARPGVITRPPGVGQITRIEVWKFDPSLGGPQTEGTEVVYGLALADLAEPSAVLAGGQEYLDSFPDPAQTPRPDSTGDRYEGGLPNLLRNSPSRLAVLTDQLEVPASAYADTRFRRLAPDLDYTFDAELGRLSLTTPLGDEDIVAVAYEYTTPTGEQISVGDVGQPGQGTSDSGPRILLKMLRNSRPTPSDPLWDLTMRNIYRIGGRALTAQTLLLDVRYQPPSLPAADVLPTVTFGDQQTLLQVFGLDRVDVSGVSRPDDLFDFNGITLDAVNGRVFFPVRRPFGDYLRDLILYGTTLDGSTRPPTATTSLEEAANLYAFPDLYELARSTAQQRLGGLSRYRITGEFRSATQSVFNIGFNIVPSTVVVTANGRRLTDGTDYTVNAAAGTVEIINSAFLQPGQQIRVEAEQNRLFAIGAKTLLGLRANYRFSENAGLGLTWMQLAERPLVDKFRVGEESFQNSIYGVDGRLLLEPRWLTRAVDALPLINTRAPSRLEIRGEIAQFNPGHPQTLAFERTRRELAADGLSLAEDEVAGLSYLDDFEGSENTFSLLEAPGWRLAARPDSAGPTLGPVASDAPVTDPARPTNWRGLFGWYSVTEQAYGELRELLSPAAQPVRNVQLYPEREFADSQERNRIIGLLDVYFDPSRRGPYNYNGELATTYAARPQDVWGGMIRRIDGSYSDFDGQNNVEFVQLLVAPLGGRNGDEAIAPGARLVVDLGRLNEDIIPDGRTNNEDGIPDRAPTDDDLQIWGRIPGLGQISGAVDFFTETGRTEDLGLDGLPSRLGDVAPGGQNYSLSEQEHFAAFLGTLPEGAERQRAVRDPSADDYHPFGEETFFTDASQFPGGASLQERFAHTYAAPELNSVIAYSRIVQSGESGITPRADSEDITGDTRASTADAYHRYEVPLDADGLAAHPFVQGTIPVGDQTFYLLRIPVRTSLRTTVGRDSSDFAGIEAIRLWTTGHDRPATLRIASFELVGSQWLKSTAVGSIQDPGAGDPGGTPPRLFIESVNNEESPDIYAIPRTAIRNEARSLAGVATQTREQSIVFRAEALGEDQSAGITRTYATRPFDLTRYTNLRMFVHGDGFAREDSVRVFVRLGDDEVENYYEYEQPVYPFDPDDGVGFNDNVRADSLWQTRVALGDGTTADLNSVNIVLSELNLLKVARDDARAPVTEPFEGASAPEGAPAGARIRIVGQPSIQRVRTLVLGVRNGTGGVAVPLDTVQVWFNELRVSGYDEAGGASGFVTANLALADLATVSARATFTEDGFGDLGSGLGTRSSTAQNGVAVTANLSAHKLLPERFGWQIPVSYSFTQNGSTPRFDPERGDLRVDDLVDAILNDTSATAPPESDRRAAADALVERTQTVSSSRNVRVQIGKTGSRSPWLRYTLDGLSASWSANAVDGRSPVNASTEQDQWSANLGYRLAVPRPQTVRPLWFTDGVPVLGSVLGTLRFNYLPQSFTFTTDIGRSLNSQQPRAQLAFRSEPDSVLAYRTRRRTTQAFDHGRTLDLQYNPFTFLRLGYGSDTDQDFTAAGQTEASRVLVYRPATDSTEAFIRSYALTLEDARLDSLVRADLRAAFGGAIPSTGPLPGFVQLLGGTNLRPLPLADALGNVFGGRGTRTRRYGQTLQATFTVSTRRVRWLSWVRPQALSYRAGFTWQDVPLPTADPDLRVANAGTTVQTQAGLQLVPREFWRLFPFYRRLEAAAGGTGRAPAGTPAGRPSAQTPTDSSATGRGGFDPARAIRTLPRTLFLAATGITDVSLTYRGTLGSDAGGLVGGRYSLLSGLRGDAPGPGFRLGLVRRLPIDQRLNDPDLNLALDDRLRDSHQLEGRTQLEPLPSLRVSLTAQTQWTRTTSYRFGYDADGIFGEEAPRTDGSGTATVVSFGGSYTSLVERHADRFRRDREAAGPEGPVPTTAFTRVGLAEDFQAEFVRGLGAFGPRNLLRWPLPGWDVTYSGLSRWPVFRSIAQNVSLRHNYSSTVQSQYTSFFTPATLNPVGGRPLVAPGIEGSSDEATAVTANRAFQPLLGLQVTWKGGIQSSLNWEQTDLYTLQATSGQMVEKHLNNLRLELSWARTGLRLFGLRRLNNNLTFNLSGSVFDETLLDRPFSTDTRALIEGRPLADVQPRRTRRYQVTPRLGYTISNQVTASVFVDYSRSIPEGGTAVPTSDFDGGVTLRILFSN